MFRLTRGEIPSKPPELVVLFMGLNDLGSVFITKPNATDADVLQEADPIAQRWVGACALEACVSCWQQQACCFALACKAVLSLGLAVCVLAKDGCHMLLAKSNLGHCLLLVARRADVIVRFLLRKLPGTEVALASLLPRGKSAHTQPSIYTPATARVNELYK